MALSRVKGPRSVPRPCRAGTRQVSNHGRIARLSLCHSDEGAQCYRRVAYSPPARAKDTEEKLMPMRTRLGATVLGAAAAATAATMACLTAPAMAGLAARTWTVAPGGTVTGTAGTTLL